MYSHAEHAGQDPERIIALEPYNVEARGGLPFRSSKNEGGTLELFIVLIEYPRQGFLSFFEGRLFLKIQRLL